MMEDDSFGDMFGEAAAKRSPAAKKFQPKARPGPKKGPNLAAKPSAVLDKEKQVAPKPSESVSNVDSSSNVPRELYSILSNIEKPKELPTGREVPSLKEPSCEHENGEPVVQQRHGDVVAGIGSLGFDEENLSDLLPMSNELVGGEGGKFQPEPKARNEICASDSSVPIPGVTNEVPCSDGDFHSSFEKSAQENEDILSQLESLDHLLTKSLNGEEQTPSDFHEGNEPSTSHSNNVERENVTLSSEGPITLSSMDINAEKDLRLPVQNSPDSSHLMETEVFQGLEAVEGFPGITKSSGGKFVPKPKAKSGAKTPDSATSQATFTDKDQQREPVINFGSEYKDDGTVPCSIDEEIFQYSSIGLEVGLEEPTLGAMISQPIDNETLNDHTEPSCFDASILEDEVQRQNSSLDNVVDVEGEKSSRQLRKRTAAPLVDESDGDAQDDESYYPDPHSSTNGEDEEGANRDENILEKKTGTRKSRASKSKDGKPSRKRKGAGEASEQPKEEPKKRFSHTTRRKRRCVDKALLQTPEEEIDHRNLPIRDLILLAEHNERLAKKSMKVSKKPSNGKSVEKASDGDRAFNREGSFPTEEGGNSSTQPSENAEPSVILFNYQTFMKKTPTIKWSKQDTELFYEGIRQFGTDLSMIKELFPKLTRHQMKLKYKKEERQNPMRLFEALGSRAKDHKHFEFVIERLQSAAAEAEKESKLENSEAVTVEDGSEDSNMETDGVDEAAKPEKDEERGNGDSDGSNGELQSLRKSQENGEGAEEEDDDDDFFSSYKSEF